MMHSAYPHPDWFVASSESYARLTAYLDLVAKWNPAINLVSAASLADGWSRHVLDSAQLVLATDKSVGRWLDIGSGAGFPGLVVAILMEDSRPDMSVTLVESDRRKATFLSTASRELGLKTEIVCARIEQLAPAHADIISARAFAPLGRLLRDAAPHFATDGVGLFLKGEQYQAEIAQAQIEWAFQCDVIPSKTNPAAVVLKVSGVSHV